jgi:hypothetical protein
LGLGYILLNVFGVNYAKFGVNYAKLGVIDAKFGVNGDVSQIGAFTVKHYGFVMDRFYSKLVSSGLDKHTTLSKQTH